VANAAVVHERLADYSAAYRTDDDVALYVDVNTRIQILETMARLPRADKEQCAAFIVRIVSTILPCDASNQLTHLLISAMSESW
jgi:hypothetical protein